jgi:hypothetical protein
VYGGGNGNVLTHIGHKLIIVASSLYKNNYIFS